MCIRCDKAGPHPREDGVTRDQELKAVLLEAIRAIRKGYRLEAFYYWSLFDNYEWGSFEPRFGLFGVDFADGARRLPGDIIGNNAAGFYKLFIEAFRAKNKDMLIQAFSRTEYPRSPLG